MSQNPFPLQLWNRITMLKADIAAEIPASNTENRRWISIQPLENDPRGRFMLWQYEVPAWVVGCELDWHTEEIFVDDYAPDETHLFQMLQIKGVDPLAFNTPWSVKRPR